jgi:hypothetical protein
MKTFDKLEALLKSKRNRESERESKKFTIYHAVCHNFTKGTYTTFLIDGRKNPKKGTN